LLDTAGFRKLPALDSKAAIREKREKEIQMKVWRECAEEFLVRLSHRSSFPRRPSSSGKNSQSGVRGYFIHIFVGGYCGGSAQK
jgi:hypothetical protein